MMWNSGHTYCYYWNTMQLPVPQDCTLNLKSGTQTGSVDIDVSEAACAGVCRQALAAQCGYRRALNVRRNRGAIPPARPPHGGRERRKAVCEACDKDGDDVEIVIEFPASGATYGYKEYGVYAYDEYPPGSVNEGMQRRRNRGRYMTLEEAKDEHPQAQWNGGGSGFVPVTIPGTAPDWFDPLTAGESWDGE